MHTTYRPFAKRQRDDLAGYVAAGPAVLRAVLFIAGAVVIGWILRAVHDAFLRDAVETDLVWLVPTLGVAALLYVRSGRWTGGAALRTAIRQDLLNGHAAVHRVNALDAVEIEEQEDEGPAFFLLDDTGDVLLFRGQYLDPYRRKGFPWTAFEIVEAPESRIFFRLESLGHPLIPSARHPAFPWKDLEPRRERPLEYSVVRADFDELKAGRVRREP